MNYNYINIEHKSNGETHLLIDLSKSNDINGVAQLGNVQNFNQGSYVINFEDKECHFSNMYLDNFSLGFMFPIVKVIDYYSNRVSNIEFLTFIKEFKNGIFTTKTNDYLQIEQNKEVTFLYTDKSKNQITGLTNVIFSNDIDDIPILKIRLAMDYMDLRIDNERVLYNPLSNCTKRSKI